MLDVGPVADDDGGSGIGVDVATAFPTSEHRLALAVIEVPISATGTGLRRSVLWDGGSVMP